MKNEILRNRISYKHLLSDFFYARYQFSAQNIHTESDWDIVFTLLECVGAGAIPPDFEDSLALSQAYRGKCQCNI